MRKRYQLGEDDEQSYAPVLPYTPSLMPGVTPTFIPGSAYGDYGPVGAGAYGKVSRENVVRDSYVANEDNMGDIKMFKLDQMLGADESFGPAAPSNTQIVAQSITDTTGLTMSTQTKVLYAVGAGIAAYYLYLWYCGE